MLEVKYDRRWYWVESLSPLGVWFKGRRYHGRWHYITKIRFGKRVYSLNKKG